MILHVILIENAIKFNACLFEQVAIFFGEDTTIPPPVIVEVEKDENETCIHNNFP